MNRAEKSKLNKALWRQRQKERELKRQLPLNPPPIVYNAPKTPPIAIRGGGVIDGAITLLYIVGVATIGIILTILLVALIIWRFG